MIQVNPKCPKCGNEMIGPKWDSERDILRFVCTCSYKLEIPPNDKESLGKKLTEFQELANAGGDVLVDRDYLSRTRKHFGLDEE